MFPKKEAMTSTSFILIVMVTVVTSAAGNNVDEALSPAAAIHHSDSTAIRSSQIPAAVEKQIDRKKRSSEFKESAAVGSDRFATLAEERPADEQSSWNDEADKFGGQFPAKRGRWAKNNVQMWGKRSLQLSGQRPSASGSSWSSSEGDAANIGLRLRSPSARSYTGSGDGTWSKRKKTWEKNNFKMWGKRSVERSDEESDAVDRYLPLIARILEERRLSRPEFSDVYGDSGIDELGELSDGRDRDVELELPSSSSLSSDIDSGRERPLSYAIDMRNMVQKRPKKKVGWSSNNVHMWG